MEEYGILETTLHKAASRMKDVTPLDSQLHTLPEVAKRLGVCEKTIHNLLNSSQLSGKFYARRWHFSEEDIQVFLKRQERKQGEKGARKKRAYTRRIDKQAS